jgi:hypothetical protein
MSKLTSDSLLSYTARFEKFSNFHSRPLLFSKVQTNRASVKMALGEL